MPHYTVTIDHGNGHIGKYRGKAKNKTEARAATPYKHKIISIRLTKYKKGKICD